jgi:tripartite-type tricarboxylate transporter receptor subunit TctC
LTADIGRALAATPGVPEDRMTILRDAFQKMVADREFQADATRIGLDLNPMNADELAGLVRDAMNMSPQLREQVTRFYEDVLEGKK